MGNRQAAGVSIALMLTGVADARSTAWSATPAVQASPATGLRGQTAYKDAIGRAVRLLPRQPVAVVLIELDHQSRFRAGKGHVEAFVNQGERVVYVVRKGMSLQAALKGPGIYDYVLAIVIWHEMAHIDGADEAAAQEAEEQLWMEFILTQRVDSTRGMQYLALLRKRR